MEKIEKLDNFIKEIEQIKREGLKSEEKRGNIGSQIKGFINGIFDKNKADDYIKYINSTNFYLDAPETAFDKKSKRMIEYLISIKEEINAKETFKKGDEQIFNNLKEDVEKNKLESERRKNVAEFKYWGFAIELIDTVRRELKEFRNIQESLKNEISQLRDDIKGNKKA